MKVGAVIGLSGTLPDLILYRFIFLAFSGIAGVNNGFHYPFALLLCTGLMPSAHASAAPFADVPSTHWAYKEIMEAYKDGAVQGTSANVYNPNGNVTMAQFIAILTRAFCSDWVENGETLVAEGASWYVLDGIAADAWYTPNYIAAEEYDLFWEVPNNSPNVEVTREVMARIMYNLISGHMDGVSAFLSVTDQRLQAAKSQIPDFSSVSESMKDAVATCYSLGLITGVDSSGRFSPQGRMNRAQTAVIYVRLKQVMETGTGIASQTGTGTSAGTSSATLTNGKPVTEENVLALIEEYKNGKAPGAKASAAGFTSYVGKSTYDAYNPSYYSSALGFSGTECAKFAFAFMDDIFGDLPAREFTGHPENIRPGDLLQFDGHWSIAATSAYIASDGKLRVQTVDGGSSGLISWNLAPTWLEFGDLVGFYTRYPK